jgi:hypothetical protein
MHTTFVTAGDVRREYNEDGTTKCYYVSRVGAAPICLQKAIPEYYGAGHHIHIDQHGTPWVRKTGKG